MCLYIESSRLKAREDIVCYKVCSVKNNRIYSKIQHFHYRKGVIYKADKSCLPHYNGYVYDGYFHSYENFNIAHYILTNAIPKKDLKIFKCIIPKGSYYFRGTHTGGNGKNRLSGYASKQIKLVEEIIVI